MSSTRLAHHGPLWVEQIAILEEIGQVDLARRLRWEAGSGGWGRGAQGELLLGNHLGAASVAIGEEAARARIGEGAGELWIAGLGEGELVAAGLRAGRRVQLWERDLWPLQQALSRLDWRQPLREGRLRLHLGVDLLSWPASIEPVLHPRLASRMAEELEAWRHPERPLCLLVEGGLMLESAAAGLRRLGWRCWGWATASLPLPALQEVAARTGARQALSINLMGGLAAFCARLGLPLAVWEIDPAIDRLRPETGSTRHVSVGTWRRAQVVACRQAGLERSGWLPLAADAEARRPRHISAEHEARYGAPVAFVGSSMLIQAQRYAAMIEQDATAWRQESGQPPLPSGWWRPLLAAQQSRADYALPQLLEEAAPGFQGWASARRPHEEVALLGEIAAAERRARIVGSLGVHGAQVWGDRGWAQLSAPGLRYRGAAGHREELVLIYNAARINVDIGRVYQPDIATLRVFEVLACGGFLLAEHAADLEQLFDIGVDLLTWRSPAELHALIRRYLPDPQARQEVAERGRARVLREHRVEQRLARLLDPAWPGRS